MGRTAFGNRAVDLDGNIVPESLFDRGVNEEADVKEWKLLFWDGGHDHTGAASGALVDLTRNLLRNSNFEYDISNGSGMPDFWYSSGSIDVDIVNSGYIGSYAARLVANPPVFPSGTTCLYQPIPSPSGYSQSAPPSGTDFQGLSYGLGLWASGNGQVALGHHDTVDHWCSPYDIADEWTWCTYRYSVDNTTTGMRALVCVDGDITIDNVLLNHGTRLISTRPTPNEADLDSWRKQNNIFNCMDSEYRIDEGDVVVVATDSYAGVTLPRYAGMGGVLGVAIAGAPSGIWIAICNGGPAKVNVLGQVSFGDLLCTEYDPDYPGYAISSEHIMTAVGDIASQVYPFAIALQNKVTDGPDQILAYINPPASKSDTINRMKALHLIPVYHGAVEGALDTDDAGLIRKGYDGAHNYYLWNYSQRALDQIVDIDFDGGASISGEADLDIDGGTYEATAMDIRSDEVYQEALLVGEIRNKYGVQVDKIGVKLLNSSVYENAWVEAAVDPGEMAGAYGVTGLYARPAGTFAAGGPAHPTRPLGFPADNEHSTEYWPAYVGRMGDDGDHSMGGLPVGPVDGTVPSGWQAIGFDLRGGLMEGTLSLSTTGIVSITTDGVVSMTGTGTLVPSGTDSYTNSIITRMAVPDDYIGWMGTGVYMWNKCTTGASLEYRIYDVNDDLVVDGGPLTNLTWTRTAIDIPTGVFTPNEFFTMYNIFTSDGDNSAYLGETSLYYHNYAQ